MECASETVVTLLVLDVDGVLTDGRLPFDDGGASGKTFYVQDGAALGLWRRAGGHVAIISGRASEAVMRRAAELGIERVHQSVADKRIPFRDVCKQLGVAPAAAAFAGDDWQDLPVMAECGYPIAVANAIPAVKRAACHVTRRTGGNGAVAEMVEHLLRRSGRWPPAP